MSSTVFAKRVDNLVEDGVNPGSFKWYAMPWSTHGALTYRCPCGCTRVATLSMQAQGGYLWDGQIEEPTLHPKVTLFEVDLQTVHWEGWLRRGLWINTRE